MICKKCGIDQPIDRFSRDKYAKSGVKSACKSCCKAAFYSWRKQNPEKDAAYRAKWSEENPTWMRDWYKARSDKYLARKREYTREWYARNKDWSAAKSATRRSSTLMATPSWANTFFIDEAYELAQLRYKATGIIWHVDHIVPLKSKLVCGLHTEANLQVIPSKQNLQKKNVFWPDMP